MNIFVVKFKESENIYIIDPDGTVHKDPTSGNGNNSSNGGNNGNNQGGNTGDGGQGGTEDPNEEIAKRDGIVLSKESMDVNNETTNTISITTNAKNLKITNSNDSVIELTEKNDKQITYVAKAIGRSTITVETEKGKKARCYVLVHQEPKKIVLDTTNIEFDLSENNNQHQITATIEPSTTNRDTDITWTSSNTNVATVNSNGYVSGKTDGTTTITVRSSSGKVSATCTITVKTSIRVTSTPQNHYTTTAGYTNTYSECTEQAQRCEPNCEQWAEKCYTFINDALGQLQCTLSGTECTHYGCTYITYCVNSVSHEEWVDGSVSKDLYSWSVN